MQKKRRMTKWRTLSVALVAGLLLLIGFAPGADARRDKQEDAGVADAYLAFSSSADRSGAQALDGANISPDSQVSVFVAPLDTKLRRAVFYVNGRRIKAERYAPYDILGTKSDGTAALFSAEHFQPGENTVSVKMYPRASRPISIKATFQVTDPDPKLPSIAEIATGDENFSTLVAALSAATESGPVDFLGAVSDPNADLTVFAPTNDAFTKLGATVDAALADPSGLLTEVLSLHVVAGGQTGAELVDSGTVTTLGGGDITISVVEGDVFINDAKVVVADIQASNGIVHVIDTVLLPTDDPDPKLPSIAEIATGDENFSTLVAALSAATESGPVDFLGAVSDPNADLTVFAPTNDAFTKLGATVDAALADPSGLLTEVLSLHVVAGGQTGAELVDSGTVTTLGGGDITISVVEGDVFINDAKVVVADIQASNGIVHVIDTVLLPTDDPDPVDPSKLTIAEVATSDPNFTTLATALSLASESGPVDFIGTVSDPAADLTVFAPTNDAFAALDPATLETVLADPSGALTSILAYHVLASRQDSGALLEAGMAETLQGSQVNIEVRDGKVYVNDSQVVIADIQTANGVIHVIDAVLIPEK